MAKAKVSYEQQPSQKTTQIKAESMEAEKTEKERQGK